MPPSLLDRGAKVNATTKLGRSALFLAAMSDHSAAIVRLLIGKGADVQVVDTFKNTMLNAATAGNDTEQPDGGWQQRDGLASDAYATGESMYALAKAGGVAPSDPAYQKGVRFLLTTQRASDGSWRVESRSPKFQAFFQSGFPYGANQWISQWATGWATMALAQALEPPSPRAGR